MREAVSLVLAVFWAGLCGAEVLHVPAEYATIQAALDALAAGDTVFVAVGEYAESLWAPPRPFVLKGDAIPDTGDYARPVINPSSLPGSDTLACLSQTDSARVVIEDLIFRTDARAYPREWGMYSGVRYHSRDITFRRCVFDSVFYGLIYRSWDLPAAVTLEECRFTNVVNIGAIPGVARLVARDCVFSGQGEVLAQGGANSEIVGCRFENNTSGHLLTVGDNSVVRDCVFGPYGPFIYAPVRVQGIRVENNLFTNCQPGMSVLDVDIACGDSAWVTGNTFIDNHVATASGSSGFGAGCDTITSDACCTAVVAGNVVMESSSNILYGAKGFGTGAMGVVEHNRFINLLPPEAPATRGKGGASVWRYNYYEGVGLAAEADTTPGGLLDARWNWWGDSTGPFHASQNPWGRGERMGSGVRFSPWLVDTTALPVSPRPVVVESEKLELRVYPSPFNSRVTVVLLPPPLAREVEIVVYNVLGAEVYRNRVLAEGVAQHVALDASAWASGSYYVSARAGELRAVRKVVLLK